MQTVQTYIELIQYKIPLMALLPVIHIMRTRLFKYIENFTSKKNDTFQVKKLIFFHISAQNIDVGTC